MKLHKRFIAIILVLVSLTTILPLSVNGAKPSIMNETEWDLLKLTNNERVKNGLKPLSAFQTLQWCADVRVGEISKFFSHTRPDGSNCMTVFNCLPNDLKHFGENVAAGYLVADDVLNVWMNSQNGHKENILYPGFSHLGTGYINIPNDDYNRYWVQCFVGDCDMKVTGCDETPIFDTSGDLVNDDVALIMSCSHGKSYMPLVGTSYTPPSTANFGTTTFKLKYDGKTYTLNCYVGYTDVNKNAWYYDSVLQATRSGLFSGTSDTEFSPNASMTRAMLVSVLYRMENSPDVGFTNTFDDVSKNSWYSKAVAWAEGSGIVSGVSDDRFAPNSNITREQIVTILFRYAQYKNKNTSQRKAVSGFADANEIHSYALESLKWAYATGMIQGKTGNKLDPLGNATRAEVCAIVIRFRSKFGV